MTLNTHCLKKASDDATKKFGVFAVDSSVTGCDMAYDFHGPMGCEFTVFDPEAIAKAVAPFIGAIFIILGLGMAFYGCKLVFHLFGVLVALIVSGVIFTLLYSFMDSRHTKSYVIIGTAVVALILGIVAAYFTKSFAKEYAVPLLALWGGIVGGLMLAKILKVNDGTITAVIAMACGVVAWKFGKEMKRAVECWGTAFIGAFFLTRGIGCYAPGYPTEFNVPNDVNSKDDREVMAYVGGFVVVFICGSLTQLYMTRHDKAEESGDGFEG